LQYVFHIQHHSSDLTKNQDAVQRSHRSGNCHILSNSSSGRASTMLVRLGLPERALLRPRQHLRGCCPGKRQQTAGPLRVRPGVHRRRSKSGRFLLGWFMHRSCLRQRCGCWRASYSSTAKLSPEISESSCSVRQVEQSVEALCRDSACQTRYNHIERAVWQAITV
ncbi:hypothetical protein CB0940_07444, partial [Cercospora beticola]